MGVQKSYTDQMGRTIVLDHPPTRIISLVPSQTELLYALGLNEEVVAQTLFCIHPQAQHLLKPRIGGTKALNIDKIKALEPHLIIGNKEENEQLQVDILMQNFPVWMSDIQNLDHALDMIEKVGNLVGREAAANQLAAEIRQSFANLTIKPANKSCLYLIWRSPFMAAGNNTFISDMLSRCGFENKACQLDGRYPQLEAEQIGALNPDTILLSSEPYPFKQKHMAELRAICPHAKIILVDGELFSWYGSGLLKSVNYFERLRKEIAGG